MKKERCQNIQVFKKRVMVFVELNLLYCEGRLVSKEGKYHTLNDGL